MPAQPGAFAPTSVAPAPSGDSFAPPVPVRFAPRVIASSPPPATKLDPAQIEQQAQAYAARMAISRAAQAHVSQPPVIQQPEALPAPKITGSEIVNEHPPIFSPKAMPAGKGAVIAPPTGPMHDIYSRLILKQMATMRAQDPTFGQLPLAQQEQKARGALQSYKPPDIGPFANEADAAQAAQMRLKNEGLPRVILEDTLNSISPLHSIQRIEAGKTPTLGSVSSDLFNTAAFMGPDELLAPVRAVKAGISAYRDAGVSADAVRAAKAVLDTRKVGRQADAVYSLDLKTSQARKDYQGTLKAAGYSRAERKSVLAAHDASALAMARDLNISPSDAWSRIYAHSQYNPIPVTTGDIQTGRVVFAQEGARPEIQNLAHTPDVGTKPPSPNFFQNAARRLVSSHQGALPDAYNTPTKFARLLGDLRQRALDAAEYKHWYSNSAQAIVAHVGGNTAEADKLAALVAIYSPRAEVYSKASEWNNLDRAINAYNEYHATGEISPKWSISSHKTGAEDWQTTRAQQVMQGTFAWHGLKTNRFYRNFLQHIDPEKYANLFGTEKFGTMDTWMRRAFQYPAKYKTETEHTLLGPYEKAIGKAQEPITPKMYSLMERATKVVADSLGWSPEEAQAAIWTSIKAEQEKTPLAQAGFDFRDAFAHRDARAKFDLTQPSFDDIKPEPSTEAGRVQTVVNQHAGKDLKGLPTTLKFADGRVTFRSNKEIQDIASRYMHDARLPYDPPATYAKVDVARAEEIARLYDEAIHAPQDPETAAAYQAMIRETLAQYRALERAGYKFEFYPAHDPYPGGPRYSALDITENRHMYVYPTEGAFGTINEITNHPLLAHSGIKWNGRSVTHNDLFRAVHDVFGHVKEGVGFRADGEENAWRSHSAMYSPEARRAMTSETRGQNSWVNYGPHGETNRTASQEGTVYADQKAVLLPRWVSENGANETTSVITEHARGVFENALAEAARMMGKVVPRSGRLGNRADRADVLNWLARETRQSNDPELHAIADVLDQAILAKNSPDPELLFQQDPLVQHIAQEQGKPMLQAAAMQVEHGGSSLEDAAKMFGTTPEELKAYMASELHTSDQARILSNADVGSGEAATTEDAKTILDRAQGRTSIKGAVARTDQGEHLLHLFQGADVSTAIHELGHAVEQYLPEALRKTLGNDPETIARTFERYFFEGGVPSEVMRPAMEKLAEGMARVYEHADAIPGAQMNPAIRRAFDDFFTREAQHTPGFTERVGASWLAQKGTPRTDEQQAADIYEPRILRYHDLEVQFPKSQSRITQPLQRGWDSTSMRLESLATRLRESSNPFAHDAGKALTPFTSRGRAPKQAAKNLLKDIARTRAARAQAIRSIARVGKRAGFLRPNEGEQLAHFYYAQLPESHRNAEGLSLIRQSLQKEYDYVTAPDGAIADLHESLDGVKKQIKALGKDATMKEIGPLLQEQGAIKQEIADIPDRIYDLSRNMAKLDKVVANAPPVNHDALAGIHQIMADRQAILEEAGVLDPQLAEERKGLLARHLGLTPDGTEAYVGHRMSLKNRGASFPRGASFGKTALPQGATTKNELALFRSGRLHQSMDSILKDWESAQGYVFHNIAKNDLTAMGVPLEGRVKDGYILVNPRGQKVPRRIHMATDEATIAEGFNPDDIAEYQSNYIGETRAEQQKIIDQATEYSNLHELRQVPRDVAAKYYERLLGKRLTIGTPGLRPAGPASAIGKGMNIATNSVYMSLIYTNPGYLPGITMQNLVFAGMHQGAFLPTNLIRAGQLLAHGPQDVRDFVKGEVGIGALESIINGRDDSLAHKFIRHIHTVPDTWPRVAAFLHEAAREGIISKVGVTISDKEYAALRDLFTNPAQVQRLRDMVDRTIQSQVDFGRLGPTEQALARKLLFVWPWIRGASHYPVRFALDHPIRTAIAVAYLGAGAPGAPISLQKKNVPSWLEDSIKAGSQKIDGKIYPQVFSTRYVSPISTPYDLAQTILAKPGANTVSQILNPLIGAMWQTANKRNSFGDAAKGYVPAAESNLSSLVPDYNLAKDLINPPQPGTRLYPGDSSRLGRIERALRIFPVPYDPAIALKDREKQGLSGSLVQVHQEQLVAGAKDAGLPPPPRSVMISLAHSTRLDHISSTSHGDHIKRMREAVAYYAKDTGDHSLDSTAKQVASIKANDLADQIYKAIREAMIGADLRQYQQAIKQAKQATTP